MERTMSVEEKIRRAEEIYERRRQGNVRPIATVSVSDKKDVKLLKKMIIQILICVSIYSIIYVVQNGNYIFSEEFIKQANSVLSYDVNFGEMYSNIKNQMTGFINSIQNNNSQNEGIGGAEENVTQNETQNQETQNTEESQEQPTQNLSQEEQDIMNIKNTASFIKPIEGTISSKYGQREEATGSVPKNHTGTDIAANVGTKIISSTDGEVVLSSEEGDYRKTFKNSNRRGEHCICSL